MEALVLNIKSALEMVGNEKDLYRELLNSFVNDRKLEVSELERLEAQEDTTEAAKYVHYFKGAGRQLGAEKLGQAGQNLEDVLRKRTTGDIKKLNKEFIEAYNEAFEKIEETRKIL